MNNFLIAPSRPATFRARPAAIALVLTIAAGGAVAGLSSGEDPSVPAQPDRAPSSPMIFGDPSVGKGAHGIVAGEIARPGHFKVFGDPRVQKGAGGR